ncbi:hypothetical protein A6527_005301 [Escherichia coli]|nr:hypothetical protein [Escherichia coli]
MFSHPVYLFLREFSLQDFRGGSSSLPIDELYEHSPAARRYPRDRVLRRLFKLNNEFQRNRIIRSLDLK